VAEVRRPRLVALAGAAAGATPDGAAGPARAEASRRRGERPFLALLLVLALAAAAFLAARSLRLEARVAELEAELGGVRADLADREARLGAAREAVGGLRREFEALDAVLAPRTGHP
jgi:hypothetical protein